MNHAQFNQNIDEKTQLYREGSIEIEFLSFLYDIIDRNYLMFQQIYGYINTINSREVVLYQITTNEGDNSIVFPDSDLINNLKKVKESLEQKLLSLLDSILPAYDINRHFLNMMENMDANTLIDRKLISKFGEECKTVVEFSDDFDELFRNFPMENYKTHLNKIQLLATNLEDGDVTFAQVKKELNKILASFDGISATMKKILNSASKLGFTKLQEATKKFHGYAMKELKSTIKYEPRTRNRINIFPFGLSQNPFKL